MKHLKISIVFLFLTLTVFAQKDLGETIIIESEILQETRELQIVLPRKYSKEKSYSIIYVTDGEKRTNHVRSITDFIKYAKKMPESIIVGIINTDRRGDLTPTKTEYHATSGKAPLFTDFLEKEVKPYIIKNYGSNHKHILTGHSLGGLLCMYTLLTKPTLFDGYVASDPSFWWDDEFIIDFAKEKLPNLKGKQQVLFINGRDGKPMKEMGIQSMKSVLEKHAPSTLDWKLVSYANETHTSVVLKGYYDGLRFIEEDFVNGSITMHPRNANVVKGKPIMLFSLDEQAEGLQYTLDGKEPIKTDSLYKGGPIFIKKEGVFKYRKNIKRLTSSKTKEILINASEPINPKKVAIKKIKNGLQYKFYEDVFNNTFVLKNRNPTKEDIVSKSYGLKSFTSSNFVCEYSGYYEAKMSEYHYFFLDGGDATQVSIANKLLLDYNKNRDGKIPSSGVLFLEKGLHPITIKYYQKDDGKKINLKAYIPNLSKGGPEKIPFTSFYTK